MYRTLLLDFRPPILVYLLRDLIIMIQMVCVRPINFVLGVVKFFFYGLGIVGLGIDGLRIDGLRIDGLGIDGLGLGTGTLFFFFFGHLSRQDAY